MKGWRRGRGYWLVVSGLFIVLVGLRTGAAQRSSASAQQKNTLVQQTQAPTLHDILQRLEENLDQYKALVPSFFCDEHVVSFRSDGDVTTTDSTFRLKRVTDPDLKAVLEESHDVKKVNGLPAAGDAVGGPTYLRGAFSNGLALVSLSQQACMRYTLKPIEPDHPYIVKFVSVPAGARPRDCPLQDDNTGRVLVDPATMQIKRMEFHAPHHLIGPAVDAFTGLSMSPIMGRWDVSVEYAPVLLGGKSFWLPTKISERMIGRIEKKEWRYDAAYSNYHKLEVTSRIVPFSGATAQ
jgi:hypothetical protein